MLSLGLCIGALALHASMGWHGVARPAFPDKSAAFWTETAISFGAVFVNRRFDWDAGADLTGR